MARELLLSLPNSTVSDIIHEANGRLHFDPAICLPHEIISSIFEYLPSESLLSAATVSKTWRELAMDPPLWRRLFALEGWTHDRDNVRSFEDKSRLQIEKIWSNPRVRARPAEFGTDRLDVKRTRLNDSSGTPEKNVRLWVEHGTLDVPPEWTSDTQHVPGDDKLHEFLRNASSILNDDVLMHGSVGSVSAQYGDSPTRNISEQAVCPLLKPSRLIDTIAQPPRPNWHWIFKQRRRLEKNWNAGRYTNFRLPRLDHREEGHTQCVYTLQFSQKHVVSGSRDKTVRVWDLETQRLKMPPLVGHSGSVLCLQFDERAERDVIISGSSDADVMIWQFSTGAIIKRLRRAHAESVLNLRFDDRYLVTCSKDKTIKLWNMKELRPADAEYPRQNTARNARYPDHIINLAAMVGDPRLDLVEPLPLYSLIMTFEGHNAAVNAIQIFENHIVSASGDRKIILWDIETGSLVRTFGGHLKGIACVQYDGRRIVSGSSDNSVRIFDSATGAEVAKMEGHSHLVRTVQAEFGDMYDDNEALEFEARQNDRRILDDKARLKSALQPPVSSQRHFVFGAKLPPGGGGNKWSKIISGSYDQSVIIWRRDTEGTWKIAKQLRQEDALHATGGDREEPAYVSEQTNTRWTAPAPEVRRLNDTNVVHTPLPSIPVWGSEGGSQSEVGPYLTHQQTARPPAVPQQRRPPLAQFLRPPASVSEEVAQAGPSNSNVASTDFTRARYQTNAVPPLQQPLTNMPAHLHPQHPHFLHQTASRIDLNTTHHQHLRRMPNFAPEIPPVPDLNSHPLAAAFREATTEALERDASRVFRLQFDARRIISSSQLPVIVGWDFANGDRDIEEASQFFGEPA